MTMLHDTVTTPARTRPDPINEWEPRDQVAYFVAWSRGDVRRVCDAVIVTRDGFRVTDPNEIFVALASARDGHDRADIDWGADPKAAKRVIDRAPPDFWAAATLGQLWRV